MGLEKASSLFFKGSYDAALKICINTLTSVDDGIEGKLKEYEKNIR